MMTRKKRTAAEVATQDEDQAVTAPAEAESASGVADSPPGDLESPAGLTARADRMMAEAAEGRAYAADRRGRAQILMTEANRKAGAIIAEATAESRELGREADRRERDAHGLAERAGWLASAAAAQEQAVTAALQATSLAEERDRMLADAAGLGERLGKLSAERGHLDGQLTAAREAGDLDAMTAIKTRLEAIADLAGSLEAQKMTAARRADAIGDGTAPGELLSAYKAVSNAHAAVRRILDQVYPDTLAAQARRALAEFRAALDGNMERIAEEQRQARQQPQRQIVHL